MLELTGFGSVLRGIGVLYWLLAVGAVALALYKNKTARERAIWTTVAVLVFGFLPAKQMVEQHRRNAFAKEAWAYFKHKCDTEAGEKIYKTFTGVRSVLVVKPLPPATDRDHFDQYWMGDPYSYPAHKDRGETRAASLLGTRTYFDRQSVGFDFVEFLELPNTYSNLSPDSSNTRRSYAKTKIDKPVSRIGISWEDISTPDGRKYWIAASRLRVVDLDNNTVAAERIGFFIESGFGSTAGQRQPWLTARGARTTCPSILNGAIEDRLFILKAFATTMERENGR